jgi:G3E family GTPase
LTVSFQTRPFEISPDASNLSGEGFVAGPTLLQRISVAFALSAIEIRLPLETLRIAIEPRTFAPFKYVLARDLEVTSAEFERLVVRLAPLFVDSSAIEPLAFLRPFLRRLAASNWYGPYRARQPVPQRRVSHLAVADPARPPDLMIFTGFLGSGKTTLINRLLVAPEMASSLVVVNEIGEIAVDHLVVQALSSPQDLLLLRNGCLCCAFGDSLSDTLCKLVERRNAGQGPYFARLIIETSGVADPIALIHALQQDRRLREIINYRGICTTVDGSAVERDVAVVPEVGRQIDAANWIVLTKTDLVDPERLSEIGDRLRARNPAAAHFVTGSRPITEDLLRAMLDRQPISGMPFPSFAVDAASHALHDGRISVATVRRGKIDEPIARLFLDLLAMAKGDELYRLKGILALTGQDRPLLFQAVRSNFHELMRLDQMAGESGLTVIGHNIDAHAIDRLLALLESDP